MTAFIYLQNVFSNAISDYISFKMACHICSIDVFSSVCILKCPIKWIFFKKHCHIHCTNMAPPQCESIYVSQNYTEISVNVWYIIIYISTTVSELNVLHLYHTEIVFSSETFRINLLLCCIGIILRTLVNINIFKILPQATLWSGLVCDIISLQDVFANVL